jgi:Na+/H+ antiporter NhaC
MDWIVLLPPIVAIVLALSTRQVYLSLFAGLWLGTTILAGGNPLLGLRELADQIVAVFADAGNTRVVLFCLLVGGLIALVQASGGVAGFVAWAQRRGWGQTRRGAELLAFFVGISIFVESSITCLTTGAVARPFFDKLKLPREKLAFYCDATSAPVCMMIPLNGWGAYILGLLAAQGVAEEGRVGLLAAGLGFNFFAWGAVVFALFTALTGWGFGPMKRAEIRARETGQLLREGATPLVSDEVSHLPPVERSPRSPLDLFVPIGVLVAMVFAGLWITGEGNITAGSGSTAVLWAVGAAIGTAMLLYALPGRRILSLAESTELVLKGSAGLVGVTLLIVFAFALGQVSRALEIGPFVASLMGDDVPGWLVAPVVFLLGCFVSFTMGSSWTGFAILIPIALPVADALGLSPALLLGAVLSGGIFGDYTSPLSDTSIISSMSAAADHVDHVNTQLPYGLMIAGVSAVGFAIAGALV